MIANKHRGQCDSKNIEYMFNIGPLFFSFVDNLNLTSRVSDIGQFLRDCHEG